MDGNNGKGPHTVHDIQYHFIWVTNDRYLILTKDTALRIRDLFRQTRGAGNITISIGHVRKNPVNLHVSSSHALAPE